MKRMIIVVLALIGVLAAFWSGQSKAQQRSSAATLLATKVGVVNMGAVYTEYERVRAFKLEMENEAAPFKEKKLELDGITQEWKKVCAGTDPKVSAQTRQMGAEILIETTRQLEDLERQFKAEVGKKLEEQMVLLNTKVNQAVQKHAATQGYHMILAFGEPREPLDSLKQFQRQMKVIDGGGMIRVYSSAEIDVTADVVKMLNKAYRQSK